MGRPLLAPLALLLALGSGARAAAAQEAPTLSGTWAASALSERWSIAEWGDACGPRPTPQGAPGGTVQIKQQGSELAVSGAGRAWSTAQCWEQMPGLSRSKHSASGNARSWQTRCTTAANDPRRATVVTTTQATDTTINMVETGQYQFIIHETTCTASVTRSRSYTLIQREGEAPPAASAAASAPAAAASAPPTASAAHAPPAASEARPATPRTCDAVGDPARLEVTPSRKVMRPGERFQFRAVVMDAAGCALPTKPTWSVAPGPLSTHATVDPNGALSVASDAGEGALGLTASVGGKGVSVTIEVTSPDKYEALLATRGFNASGESENAAVAVIATGTIGGRTTVGEDLARERKNLFVVIVGALAACLGFVGLILVRRGRRRAASGEPPPEDTLAAEAFGEEEGAGASEEADASAGRAGEPENGELATPADHEAAGAAPALARAPLRRQPAPKPRGKICPTCGERYPSDAMFCGRDGTNLVLIN